MAFLDKIAAAVLPAADEEDRAKARSTAQSAARPNDWLTMVLEHHRQIEAGFAEALQARDAPGRTAAMKRLAMLLTAHANAEETVLYPALADAGHKTSTGMAFEEQAMTKIQFAKLEQLDPMSEEWTDKLEHIQSAVLQHVYQEEGSWFPDLMGDASPERHAQLTARFTEEFDRYARSAASHG